MNEAQYKQQLKEQGYAEAQTRDYEPNSAAPMHTHDKSAFVLVLTMTPGELGGHTSVPVTAILDSMYNNTYGYI